MTTTVEFYVRSAQSSKPALPLATTDIDERAEAYARNPPWSCPFCGKPMEDLATIRRPAAAWPEVMVVLCDQGQHRVDDS